MYDYSTSLSALNSFGVVTQTIANNIANMNTDGYKAQIARLESGPQDRGVQVSGIYRDMSPGPAVINHLSENDVRSTHDVAAQGMRNSQENYDTAQAQDVNLTQQADSAGAWHAENYRAGKDAESQIRGITQGSNVDLPREFANLAVTETAFSANAATIRAMDELSGSILSMKV